MKNNSCLPLLIITLLLYYSSNSFGQHKNLPAERDMYSPLETIDDPYLPNAHMNKNVSPAYKYSNTIYRRMSTSTITTYQVNVDVNGQNILGDAANEPNIAVNPLNKNEMAIGWRQFDNVLSNFRQAGWAYTTDGGQHWTFPGSIDSGIFRSDPVLDFDASGNFYYNSLTIDPDTNYLCKVFKSTTGGASWNTGANAGGGDKQWMTIDRTMGTGGGNIYADWNQFSSSCFPGFFTRSENGGVGFDSCTELSANPDLGTMVVGNSGELYIAGRYYLTTPGYYLFIKSTDAQIPGSLITWSTPDSVYLDGILGNYAAINPAGLIGQIYIDVDPSNTPGQDNIYMFASLARIANIDSGDVMFAKSTDGGNTWSAPVKINDDNDTTNTQWLAVMSVAPNGRIDAAWLDTRDESTGSDSSALYYSYSNDQGNTWSVNEKLSSSFDPHLGYPNQPKMGDYIDMISDNAGADLAWTNTLNGEEDVYYSRIIPAVATGVNATSNNIKLIIYPNPSNGIFALEYDAEHFKIEIGNLLGNNIYSDVCSKSCEIDISSQPSGVYFLKITNQDGRTTVKRIIISKFF